jgi:hypothetical protein
MIRETVLSLQRHLGHQESIAGAKNCARDRAKVACEENRWEYRVSEDGVDW